MLVKELQSLCLDVRVLDGNGEEIELKNDDDDDYIPGIKDEYRADDTEIESSGFVIEDVPEGELDLDADGDEDADGYGKDMIEDSQEDEEE